MEKPIEKALEHRLCSRYVGGFLWKTMFSDTRRITFVDGYATFRVLLEGFLVKTVIAGSVCVL